MYLFISIFFFLLGNENPGQIDSFVVIIPSVDREMTSGDRQRLDKDEVVIIKIICISMRVNISMT